MEATHPKEIKVRAMAIRAVTQLTVETQKIKESQTSDANKQQSGDPSASQQNGDFGQSSEQSPEHDGEAFERIRDFLERETKTTAGKKRGIPGNQVAVQAGVRQPGIRHPTIRQPRMQATKNQAAKNQATKNQASKNQAGKTQVSDDSVSQDSGSQESGSQESGSQASR